jgi:PAS domain S-box-containing protein
MPLEFLPPSTRESESPDGLRRARVVAIASLVIIAVAIWFAFVQTSYGRPRIGLLSLGVAGLAACGLALLRATGWWRAVGVGLCLTIFGAAAFASASSGGTLVTGSFYLGLVPLLLTLVSGARAGACGAVACAVFLCGIEWLRRGGFDFPVEVGPDIAAESAFRGALIFQLALLLVAIMYDQIRMAGLRDVVETDARYRALEGRGDDLVFELDAEGTLRFASTPDRRSVGWSPDTPLGSGKDPVHQVDRERFREPLERAFAKGAREGEPIRIQSDDGSWRWYEPSITTYETPDGEPRSIIVARDLTERYRVEERLRQSQKMDAIGQLAGGVAHDFNNLLMVIGGYAEQLASEPARSAEDCEALLEVLRATEQGEVLTRQLLAVIRPSPTAPRPVDLGQVIQQNERMVSRMIGEDILLELYLSESLPPVLADPGHLEQILVNLAVNARDAMPEGGRLRIETQAEAERVVLRVADSGMGMDAETRERIFEAFFTTKKREQGAGLGLYIVYSLVHEMGGDIRVESAASAGTTFCITFPIADATSQPRAVEAEGEWVPRGSETLLVVEDRDPIRRLVCGALEAAGYRVLTAPDGTEGLRLARSFEDEIHLVLSDVVMPQMSGPEMARAVRELRPQTRFLFMSGHPERAGRMVARSEGAVVLKPILPSDLCRKVREALDT